MIFQALFLFASCINFKDFHFETSSMYYKISYTYVILVQNFGQLYSIVLLMQSAYSEFWMFLFVFSIAITRWRANFFSSEKSWDNKKKNGKYICSAKWKKKSPNKIHFSSFCAMLISSQQSNTSKSTSPLNHNLLLH